MQFFENPYEGVYGVRVFSTSTNHQSKHEKHENHENQLRIIFASQLAKAKAMTSLYQRHIQRIIDWKVQQDTKTAHNNSDWISELKDFVSHHEQNLLPQSVMEKLMTQDRLKLSYQDIIECLRPCGLTAEFVRCIHFLHPVEIWEILGCWMNQEKQNHKPRHEILHLVLILLLRVGTFDHFLKAQSIAMHVFDLHQQLEIGRNGVFQSIQMLCQMILFQSSRAELLEKWMDLPSLRNQRVRSECREIQQEWIVYQNFLNHSDPDYFQIDGDEIVTVFEQILMASSPPQSPPTSSDIKKSKKLEEENDYVKDEFLVVVFEPHDGDGFAAHLQRVLDYIQDYAPCTTHLFSSEAQFAFKSLLQRLKSSPSLSQNLELYFQSSSQKEEGESKENIRLVIDNWESQKTAVNERALVQKANQHKLLDRLVMKAIELQCNCRDHALLLRELDGAIKVKSKEDVEAILESIANTRTKSQDDGQSFSTYFAEAITAVFNTLNSMTDTDSDEYHDLLRISIWCPSNVIKVCFSTAFESPKTCKVLLETLRYFKRIRLIDDEMILTLLIDQKNLSTSNSQSVVMAMVTALATNKHGDALIQPLDVVTQVLLPRMATDAVPQMEKHQLEYLSLLNQLLVLFTQLQNVTSMVQYSSIYSSLVSLTMRSLKFIYTSECGSILSRFEPHVMQLIQILKAHKPEATMNNEIKYPIDERPWQEFSNELEKCLDIRVTLLLSQLKSCTSQQHVFKVLETKSSTQTLFDVVHQIEKLMLGYTVLPNLIKPIALEYVSMAQHQELDSYDPNMYAILQYAIALVLPHISSRVFVGIIRVFVDPILDQQLLDDSKPFVYHPYQSESRKLLRLIFLYRSWRLGYENPSLKQKLQQPEVIRSLIAIMEDDEHHESQIEKTDRVKDDQQWIAQLYAFEIICDLLARIIKNDISSELLFIYGQTTLPLLLNNITAANFPNDDPVRVHEHVDQLITLLPLESHRLVFRSFLC